MGMTRLFDGLDFRLSALLCGGLLFTACAGGEVISDADAEGDAAEDLGAEETSDSGARDTGRADSGATDAADAGDTTVSDTTTADTTVADTTDTGVEDTTVADTTAARQSFYRPITGAAARASGDLQTATVARMAEQVSVKALMDSFDFNLPDSTRFTRRRARRTAAVITAARATAAPRKQ